LPVRRRFACLCYHLESRNQMVPSLRSAGRKAVQREELRSSGLSVSKTNSRCRVHRQQMAKRKADTCSPTATTCLSSRGALLELDERHWWRYDEALDQRQARYGRRDGRHPRPGDSRQAASRRTATGHPCRAQQTTLRLIRRALNLGGHWHAQISPPCGRLWILQHCFGTRANLEL
jgi:hypothetical protein